MAEKRILSRKFVYFECIDRMVVEGTPRENGEIFQRPIELVKRSSSL
jgi:hypothetical protein